MKNIILLFILTVSNLGFSQNYGGVASSSGGQASVTEALRVVGGSGSTFFNKPNKLKGSVYVFKNFNNLGVVQVSDKKYKLNNVNINIKQNRFEILISKDSIYAFKGANLKFVNINGRVFKSFYFPETKTDKIFEVIYDGQKFKVLKGFELGIKYGTVDPLMVKKTVDNYFTKITYYVKKGKDINKIIIRRKALAVFFKDKTSLVNKFIKTNKLSYKKDRDLKRIFYYYNSLL